MVVDKNTFSEWDTNIEESNPCEYPGYEEKIQNLKRKTNLDEAVITGVGKIDGSKAVIGVCDTRFLMGSMGEVVGEKLTRAVEKATEQKLPVIIFTCSGGARMQEGIVSLMQTSTRAPVPCTSIRTNAWIAAHANRCARLKPSSMKMICQTSGPGTRMPQSASSLKSAIWAALPQPARSARIRSR